MIRTRIAPSPTGSDVHVGTVVAALMNWAYAKKNNGQFIIRIEDTDQTRIVSGGEKKMLDTLNRLGLEADESPIIGGPYSPYRQSERLDIYKQHTEKLIKKGKAYYCTCTPDRLAKMREEQQKNKQVPKYDRHCLTHQQEIKDQIKNDNTKYVIRLRIPDNQKILIQDVVRGEIVFHTKDIDDQVLLKSDGYPTYHLGVVVDDHLMKISHVIRGEEWLPSTPKHVILYQAFGWDLPVFAHISLLRNPDKSKLSKRKNPVWASEYLNQGILPEALLNYLSLMGWSHPDNKDIFTLDEYEKVFDIKDIQKTAPVFDPVKLEWMNGEYIRKLKTKNLKLKIIDFYKNKNIQLPEDLVEKTIPLIQERIKKLSDYLPLCDFLFKKDSLYKDSPYKDCPYLKEMVGELGEIIDWKADNIGVSLQQLVNRLKLKPGDFFMNLRLIITGKKISPPLNESMEILGKEECLRRIKINITS